VATVLITREGGITRLTLNRPDKLNAFTEGMHAELKAALIAANGEEHCRVVVLTGAGRAFSAGQDLAEVAGGADGAHAAPVPAPRMDTATRLETLYNPLVTLIATLDKPVIAAVNGIAAGAGANIALACDLVVAARSATFLQAFSRIGLVPDAGGTFFLPRLIGAARARGLVMLAEPLAAEQAEVWGLIWKAVDDAKLAEEVASLARKLAGAATYGLGLAKRALAASFSNTLAAQLDLERDLQQLAASSPDAREGIAAFLAKRTAKFTGRRA
jgi:2-(1,2-epoxy-1,2-dihydrophenyl)acetyl-CoA isomerase